MNDANFPNDDEDWSQAVRFRLEQRAEATFGELKELVELAESVTDQIDELSDKLNRVRMQSLTVFGVLYLSAIVVVVILATTYPTINFASSSVGGWATMGAGLAVVMCGAMLLATYQQRISKLSRALRQEFIVQQGLFTFIDDFLGSIHRREISVSAVQLALIHMQVKRLHRPEPTKSLLQRMFGFL